MVQIRPLQQKTQGRFRFWRRVKIRIRIRRQWLKESFDDAGRTFPDPESDDGESGGDAFDLRRTGRTRADLLGFSPCWGIATSGRWLRIACRKFLFRPGAVAGWTVNASRERENEPVQKVQSFCDNQDTSGSDRNWAQEKERGKARIGTWMHGRGGRSLRAYLIGDSDDAEDQQGVAVEKPEEEEDRIVEGCYGCSGAHRSWRSRSKSRKEADELGICDNRKKRDEDIVAANNVDDQAAALPDDIIEMCLARTPFASLMRARAVCKKWKSLTSSPHFLHMRDNVRSLDPWLFLFGLSRNGVCFGQIQALDPASSRWHMIDANILTGRLSYSVTAVNSVIYVVGGCSTSSRLGPSRGDKESLKTLKTVLRYTPVNGSWKKVCPMTTERSAPIVGVFNMSKKTSSWRERTQVNPAHCAGGGVGQSCGRTSSSPCRRQTCDRGSRRGGELAVYGGAENHARETNNVGRMCYSTAMSTFADLRKCGQHESSVGGLEADFKNLDVQGKRTGAKEQRSFGLIAVGGQGAWNEQLDSAEIYDPVTDRWRMIASLPADHGTSCAGVVCKTFFYVYSESNKLAAYDLEHDVWHSIRVLQDPARLLDYTPKLVSCRDRIFLLGVAWGLSSDGASETATREIWELRQGPESAGWESVSQHPDAPLDWNAAFVADEERIFGVEMFKIFGQMLDFVTVCKISGSGGMAWERVSRIDMAMNGMDPSSCLTKSALVVRL